MVPALPEKPAIPGEAPRPPIDAFLDRLLASPRHGEHWARHWLDIGQYADTQGKTQGRDHNSTAEPSSPGPRVQAVNPGGAHGESDEWSWKAPSGGTTGHDFHATILHLLGLNHETLGLCHDGIRRRLTDVHGRVVKESLS